MCYCHGTKWIGNRYREQLAELSPPKIMLVFFAKRVHACNHESFCIFPYDNLLISAEIYKYYY